MIASQSRDATFSRESFPSPEMTEILSFSEQYPSFHSNLTAKQSEKDTPAREVHFSRPELTERWSPTEYSFFPSKKELSEDSFGVLLDANDTPNFPNLTKKIEILILLTIGGIELVLKTLSLLKKTLSTLPKPK